MLNSRGGGGGGRWDERGSPGPWPRCCPLVSSSSSFPPSPPLLPSPIATILLPPLVEVWLRGLTLLEFSDKSGLFAAASISAYLSTSLLVVKHGSLPTNPHSAACFRLRRRERRRAGVKGMARARNNLRPRVVMGWLVNNR